VAKVNGKFLFVGLANSGKSTLISLMSGERKFLSAGSNLDFMLAGEGGKLTGGKVKSADVYEKEIEQEMLPKNEDGSLKTPRDASETAADPATNAASSVGGSPQLRPSSISSPPSPARSPREPATPRSDTKGVSQLKHLKLLPLPPPSSETTSSLCYARGYTFTAVDVPGRPAFRHLWYNDLKEVCCVVLVVDVSDVDNMPLNVEQVRRLGKEGGGGKLPVLVLGNKCDLLRESSSDERDENDINTEEDLANALQLEKWLRNGDRMWTVRMVSAAEMESVAQAILWAVEERFRF
jgi:GTPase SAR1 family protein